MASEIVEYLRKPESIERFSDVLGNTARANRYIQSVAIAVASSDDLLACTPRSVMSAALRCASLQLSCDPAVRQGQLVPFKNFKTGEMEAALIIHYLGLVALAERTNKYRTINVREIYEGWEVMENVYSGLHAISVPGLGILQDGYMPRWNMKGKMVIGYLGYFETHRGFKKSIYMTIEEIEDHAKKFSKGYNSTKSLWKDPKHLPTMRMKTVIRALAKWMDLGSDNDALTKALEDFDGDPYDYEAVDSDEVIETEFTEADSGQFSEEDIYLDGDFDPAELDGPPDEGVDAVERYTPESLREALQKSATSRDLGGATLAVHPKNKRETDRDMLAPNLENCFAEDTDSEHKRKVVLNYLWGVDSVKPLSAGKVLATKKWLNVTKDSGDEWRVDPLAVREAQAIYRAALIEEGQTQLPL